MDAVPILIRFDPKVYRLKALMKAAYRLGDRCYARVETGEDGSVNVILTPKVSMSESQRRELAGRFETETLDQELREIVAEETIGIRNLLLAQAFSQTSLLDPAGEQGELADDPLGIREPDRRVARPSSETE